MSDRLLTTAEVAERLGITSRHVRWLIDEGRLEATKTGRDWLIAASDLARVERRKVGRPRKEREMTEYRVVTRSGDRQEYIGPAVPTLEEAARSWRGSAGSVPVCYIEGRPEGGEWRVVLPTEYQDLGLEEIEE